MPVIEVDDRVLIPAGEYRMALREVSLKRVKSQYATDDDGKREKLMWRFETIDVVDPHGEPYEHAEWTGIKYGNPQARMTILLDQLVPGLTASAARGFDTDTLINRLFKAVIKHIKLDGGQTVAQIAFIQPVKKAVLPTAETFGDE